MATTPTSQVLIEHSTAACLTRIHATDQFRVEQQISAVSIELTKVSCWQRRSTSGDRGPSTGSDAADEHAVKSPDHRTVPDDVFGNEEGNGIQYKTMGWKMTAFLMISEVVSNGVLALPSSAAAVGLVPMAIIILFLGIFGTFTGILLVNFKLRHPRIHNMGDAGQILFGRVGGVIFFWGTILISILAQGSHILAGTFALATFSQGRLCMMGSAAIFLVPCIVGSLPRRLGAIEWLGVVSTSSILLAGIVGMIGAGVNPITGRAVSCFIGSGFYQSFVAITTPVFAFAGHFIFFVLMSEMKDPADAKKSVCVLQAFSTTFYLVFVVVVYYHLGDDVASPSFDSLPSAWKTAGYAVAIPSFIISAMLSAHIAVKLLFVKYLKGTNCDHWISTNDIVGWIVWTLAIVLVNTIALVLAIAIPIFNLLLGLAASLFASWFSYGFSGMFGLHTIYHDEGESLGNMWSRRRIMLILCSFAVISGGFICVAGTYTSIRGIVEAYNSGDIGKPFSCG